jgi:hypothetical protein
MTWMILSVVLVLGVIAYRKNIRSPSPSARRKTFAWAWAFWGAVLGSIFGVAVFGAAIAGTSVGALIGFLAASVWLKVDPDDPGSPSSGLISRIQTFLDESAAAAAQEHNAPIHSKIADIDKRRKVAMSDLYGAASERQRKKAATTMLSLDKQRARLVRQLR